MAPAAHFFERASEAQPSRQRRRPGKAPGTRRSSTGGAQPRAAGRERHDDERLREEEQLGEDERRGSAADEGPRCRALFPGVLAPRAGATVRLTRPRRRVAGADGRRVTTRPACQPSGSPSSRRRRAPLAVARLGPRESRGAPGGQGRLTNEVQRRAKRVRCNAGLGRSGDPIHVGISNPVGSKRHKEFFKAKRALRLCLVASPHSG